MMVDENVVISIREVKRNIYEGIVNCSSRGLNHTAKWLAELNHGIDTSKTIVPEFTLAENNPPVTQVAADEYDAYYLAKSFFDCREYSRAAYFTESCESNLPRFLHLYADYMAKEKRRLDNMTDTANLNQTVNHTELSDLLATMKKMHAQRKMDGYMLYLYGVVLKKLDLPDMAKTVLVESIHATPILWSSWIELAPLITSRESLNAMQLPNHWMKHIFLAHCMIDLYMNDQGLKLFEELQAAGFKNSVYITSQMAIAYHNKRNVDKAIAIFQNIQAIDPYRLENLDIFSNLLFVKEMKKEMSFLAHKAVEINKYRPETCCVIGNYYSIRSDHQKAIIYFQRALKLDPQYLSAWTLMGHEFMEMKNTNAAIQSYRKTIEVSQRDYRAWYGLGQAYEILKMPMFSLHYYKIAHQLRPYDSRMLVALGETYEKLEKFDNGLKCFQKACNVGDIEGIALLRLADLYKKLGYIEKAVPHYISFCADERAAVDKSSLCRALVTLGNYYESKADYDQASHYAYRCLEYDDTKMEARSLLKSIENKRAIASKTASATGTAPETTETDGTSTSAAGPSTSTIGDVSMDMELPDDDDVALLYNPWYGTYE